jgi:hypothetical protein
MLERTVDWRSPMMLWRLLVAESRFWFRVKRLREMGFWGRGGDGLKSVFWETGEGGSV